MKKFSLILFLTGIIGVGLLGSQCKRPVVTPSNNNNGDTITNTPKDTSGETLYITCKDGITASAKIVPGGVVYLINNYDDWQKIQLNGVQPPFGFWPAKASYKMAVADGTGQCQFVKVHPPSETVKHGTNPGHSGGYIYNIIAFKIDKVTGDTDKIQTDWGYSYDGKAGQPITVNINNNPKLPHNVEVVFP